MNEITWTLNLKVKDGPTFAPTSTMKVEAYDKVDVEVSGGKEETVRIQPGTREEIQFLMLIRTDPKVDPPAAGTVLYRVSSTSGSTGGGKTSGSNSGGMSAAQGSESQQMRQNTGGSDSSAESTGSTSMPQSGQATGTQGSEGDGWIALDYVHVVLGPGALLLLKDEPQEITFKNTQERTAQITVLVGRTATREEPPAGTSGLTGLRL